MFLSNVPFFLFFSQRNMKMLLWFSENIKQYLNIRCPPKCFCTAGTAAERFFLLLSMEVLHSVLSAWRFVLKCKKCFGGHHNNSCQNYFIAENVGNESNK